MTTADMRPQSGPMVVTTQVVTHDERTWLVCQALVSLPPLFPEVCGYQLVIEGVEVDVLLAMANHIREEHQAEDCPVVANGGRLVYLS